MKKPTVKQQLIEADNTISLIFNDMCTHIGKDKVHELLHEEISYDLEYVEGLIQDEKGYIKENPPGSTYSSGNAESRKVIKHLQKIRQNRVKIVKLFEQFIKLTQKTDKM